MKSAHRQSVVSVCARRQQEFFVDEADDLTLKVKAKNCNCAGQLYGSTMTTKDTSVASLTQFTGKNQSETGEVLSAEGAHLTATTRIGTERSLRLNSSFQRTFRKVLSLPNVSAACAHQQHLRFRFAIEQWRRQQLQRREFFGRMPWNRSADLKHPATCCKDLWTGRYRCRESAHSLLSEVHCGIAGGHPPAHCGAGGQDWHSS